MCDTVVTFQCIDDKAKTKFIQQGDRKGTSYRIARNENNVHVHQSLKMPQVLLSANQGWLHTLIICFSILVIVIVRSKFEQCTLTVMFC